MEKLEAKGRNRAYTLRNLVDAEEVVSALFSILS
jgi:hypothetical protein